MPAREVSQVTERQDPSSEPQRPRPDEFEIRTAARGDRVPGLRALAAEMAMRADLDLDTIANVQLAVEEACATVLANADPDGQLVCRLLISPTELGISAFVVVSADRELSVSQLSLRILRALSDSVDYWSSKTDDVRRFHVELAKSFD
jgi:serine/threonine-protein kinase RsbW